MVKRTRQGQCPNCQKPNSGGKYIYPIPEGFLEEIRKDPIAGAVVCKKCAPALMQAQVDQGLVVPIGSPT